MSHLREFAPKRWLATALAFATCACLASAARAQDLEPRAYSEVPVGLNFAIAGYGYTNGEVSAPASVPLTNASVEGNGAVLAYARSIDVFGDSGKIDMVLPWGGVSGSAAFLVPAPGTSNPLEIPRSRRVTGFGDPSLRISVNLYGAPAMSLEEFADYKQNVIVGASLQVTAPLGQYSADKLLNVGTNRWTFKPEVGISKSWDPLILELMVAARIYTNNGDFLEGVRRVPEIPADGKNRLEQDPVFSAQAHVIYPFRRGIWGALDFTYYEGGETTVNGFPTHNAVANTRVGGTLAFPVNRYNSIKIYGSTGVTERTKSNFDLIGIGWQVRWGAGL
ncbi:MAG: transporter [Myxococcota bacterium]